MLGFCSAAAGTAASIPVNTRAQAISCSMVFRLILPFTLHFSRDASSRKPIHSDRNVPSLALRACAATLGEVRATIFLRLTRGEEKVKLCAMALLIITSAGMFCGFACAEEGGSGHYLPGTAASFIDMLPDRGTSTFVYVNAFTYYQGTAGASRDLQLGGQVAANVKGTVYADTSIFLYQAPPTCSGQAR